MQDFANTNINRLGSLLLLEAPKGMRFGIDNQIWTIGPNFKGVKLIPPGAHFISYSLEDENHASKMGFFIFVKTKVQDFTELVFVRKWDIQN